jgi:hypothetical protein
LLQKCYPTFRTPPRKVKQISFHSIHPEPNTRSPTPLTSWSHIVHGPSLHYLSVPFPPSLVVVGMEMKMELNWRREPGKLPGPGADLQKQRQPLHQSISMMTRSLRLQRQARRALRLLAFVAFLPLQFNATTPSRSWGRASMASPLASRSHTSS